MMASAVTVLGALVPCSRPKNMLGTTWMRPAACRYD